MDYTGVLGFLEGPVMLPENYMDQQITPVLLDSLRKARSHQINRLHRCSWIIKGSRDDPESALAGPLSIQMKQR